MDKQKDIIKIINSYKFQIFDLDGTIIDLGVDWQKLKKVLSEYMKNLHGVNYSFTPLDPTLNIIKLKFGDSIYKQLNKIISEVELNDKNHKPNFEIIKYINCSNKPFVIYSMNTKKCVNEIIKKYLTRNPDFLIYKEICIEPKPTEKDLNKIIMQTKLTKKDVVFIGNSESDYISGKKSNIKTIII